MSDATRLEWSLIARGHNADDVYWMAMRYLNSLDEVIDEVANKIDSFWIQVGDSSDVESVDSDCVYVLLEDLAYTVSTVRELFIQRVEGDLRYAESN